MGWGDAGQFFVRMKCVDVDQTRGHDVRQRGRGHTATHGREQRGARGEHNGQQDRQEGSAPAASGGTGRRSGEVGRGGALGTGGREIRHGVTFRPTPHPN